MMTSPQHPHFTTDEREQLILEHLPQVKLIARKISQRIGGRVDIEDLISTGVIGLISAIDRYDPTRSIKLKTYVDFRIRGAILDSLRDLDTLSRNERQMAKGIERTTIALQQELGRQVSHDEVAAAMGLSREAYDAVMTAYTASEPYSLDRMIGQDDQTSPTTFLADSSTPSPEAQVTRSELANAITDAVHALPSKDAHLIDLHYHHGFTLRALAAMMEITESQAHDARRRAVKKIRNRLAQMHLITPAQPVQATMF